MTLELVLGVTAATLTVGAATVALFRRLARAWTGALGRLAALEDALATRPRIVTRRAVLTAAPAFPGGIRWVEADRGGILVALTEQHATVRLDGDALPVTLPLGELRPEETP